MPTLYILCGLPFSGKSLFSKEIEQKASIKRISFDDIWNTVIKANQKNPYKVTLKEVEEALIKNLSAGISVVYDSANLKLEYRNKLKKLAEEIGAQVKIIYLPNSVSEIKRRRALSLRDESHHIVKDKDFNRAIEELEPPTDCIILSTDEEKSGFLESLVIKSNFL